MITFISLPKSPLKTISCYLIQLVQPRLLDSVARCLDGVTRQLDHSDPCILLQSKSPSLPPVIYQPTKVCLIEFAPYTLHLPYTWVGVFPSSRDYPMHSRSNPHFFLRRALQQSYRGRCLWSQTQTGQFSQVTVSSGELFQCPSR